MTMKHYSDLCYVVAMTSSVTMRSCSDGYEIIFGL